MDGGIIQIYNMKLTFLKYASEVCAGVPGCLIGIGIFNLFRLRYDLTISNGLVLYCVFMSCMIIFALGTMGTASKIMEWMERFQIKQVFGFATKRSA